VNFSGSVNGWPAMIGVVSICVALVLLVTALILWLLQPSRD
jgi:hypothetical protein